MSTMKLLTKSDVDFFFTFGFLVVREAIDSSLREHLISAYDDAFEANHYFRPNIEIGNHQPVLNGVTTNSKLCQWFVDSPIDQIMTDLLGVDAIYVGSDLSTFSGGSNWHRDGFTALPPIKCSTYLQPGSPSEGGQFCLIPGSHIAGDKYAGKLSNGFQWPQGVSWADGTFTSELNLKTGVRSFTNPPLHAINFEFGDLIFFDARLIHGVTAGSSLRRLISIVYTKGPGFSHNDLPRHLPEFRGLNCRQEIIASKIAEIIIQNSIGRDYSYGIPFNSTTEQYISKFREASLFFNSVTPLEASKIDELLFQGRPAAAYKYIEEFQDKSYW